MLRFLDPSHLIGALLLGGLFFVAGLVLSSLVHRVIGEALRHDRSEHLDRVTISFARHLAVLAVWLILATFYAHLVPALNRLGTALLAGVSLVSIVVGFAAQTTLGNLIAGTSLVLYKPFGRGDRVQIVAPTKDGFEVGVVEDISLGYTVLRTDDGRELIVANGTMAQNTMIKLPAAAAEQTKQRPPQGG